MDCKFVVGQKVVCLKGPWTLMKGVGPNRLPIAGQIYTIAAMKLVREWRGVILNLRELDREAWFDYKGFCPLQDRPKETDISVFYPLLNVKERERV